MRNGFARGFGLALGFIVARFFLGLVMGIAVFIALGFLLLLTAHAQDAQVDCTTTPPDCGAHVCNDPNWTLYSNVDDENGAPSPMPAYVWCKTDV